MKSISDLDFYHFSTSSPGVFSELNERCFELWEKNWIETFRELNVAKKTLSSDDFLSKELGGLFFNNRPVGFLLYHFCDLEKRSHQKMSYFENYPEDVRESIIGLESSSMIITYMTLDSAWRKSETDLPISELLIGFSVLRLMESSAKRILGYFRNNRGTQNIFYRHGGIPISKGKQAYNVEVDFAQITRESARLSPLPNCLEMTIQKWNRFNHRKEPTHEPTNTLILENGGAQEVLRENALGQLQII